MPRHQNPTVCVQLHPPRIVFLSSSSRKDPEIRLCPPYNQNLKKMVPKGKNSIKLIDGFGCVREDRRRNHGQRLRSLTFCVKLDRADSAESWSNKTLSLLCCHLVQKNLLFLYRQLVMLLHCLFFEALFQVVCLLLLLLLLKQIKNLVCNAKLQMLARAANDVHV